MFKVVLSRVFDLRCNLEEISGAGEPLLLFSKEEEDAAAKAKRGSSSSSAGAASGEGATTEPLKSAKGAKGATK